ncbi:MAG: hypothetical protein HC904_13210 [Blastochloris sp.]|nr:hypothetical protein [Blastochloris sp.]
MNLSIFFVFLVSFVVESVFPDNSELLAQGSNPLQRITEIRHEKADGSEIVAYSYQHDIAGQLTTENTENTEKPLGMI